MRWVLGLSFLSVAVWALFPDKYERDDQTITRSAAFTTTLIAFFCAEIGDKTQIATVGLAAQSRVMVEKPFGNDLASAQALNETIHRYFPEESVYRTDHWLGVSAAGSMRVVLVVIKAPLQNGVQRGCDVEVHGVS